MNLTYEDLQIVIGVGVLLLLALAVWRIENLHKATAAAVVTAITKTAVTKVPATHAPVIEPPEAAHAATFHGISQSTTVHHIDPLPAPAVTGKPEHELGSDTRVSNTLLAASTALTSATSAAQTFHSLGAHPNLQHIQDASKELAAAATEAGHAAKRSANHVHPAG